MVGEGAAMAAAMAALLVQIRRFDRHHHRVLGGGLPTIGGITM
jgi:hypothetical protein